MAAKLFFLPFPTAFNSNGLALPGAKLEFYLAGTSTPAPTYTASDLETENEWPVPANGAGRFPSVYLDSSITYRLVITNAAGTTLEEVDPYIPGTVVASPGINGGVGSSAGNAALFAAANGMEIGEGITSFRTAGHSVAGIGGAEYVYDADVDDDYVADFPLSSFLAADGRGFRLHIPAPGITLEMLGAAGDDSTDNHPAFMEALRLVSVTSDMYAYASGPKILIGDGIYRINSPLSLKKTVCIEGQSGGRAGGQTSVLKFAVNSKGIIINATTTDDDEIVDASTGGADGTVLRNLYLLGQSTIASDAHGITPKAIFVCENVSIGGFGGDGIHIWTNGNDADATKRGNVNTFRIFGGRIHANRKNGIFIAGGNSSAGLIQGVDFTGNADWGLYDVSFLGNNVVGCHWEGNGVPDAAGRTLPAVASYGGDWYTVVPEQETLAATTQPGTNANVWARIRRRGENPGHIVAWTSGGQTWRSGGPFCHLSQTGGCNVIHGPYTEGSQPPAYVVSPATVLGGTHGAGIAGTGTYLYTEQNAFASNNGFETVSHDGTGLRRSQRHAFNGFSNDELWSYYDRDTAPLTWRKQFQSNGDLTVSYNNVEAFRWLGPNSTFLAGRLAASPSRVAVPEIALGAASDARFVSAGPAAPSTGYHAQGEFVLNNAPTAGGNAGWACVTAGTPGTWKAFGAIDA